MRFLLVTGLKVLENAVDDRLVGLLPLQGAIGAPIARNQLQCRLGL